MQYERINQTVHHPMDSFESLNVRTAKSVWCETYWHRCKGHFDVHKYSEKSCKNVSHHDPDTFVGLFTVSFERPIISSHSIARRVHYIHVQM